jgi:hypothetical protein
MSVLPASFFSEKKPHHVVRLDGFTLEDGDWGEQVRVIMTDMSTDQERFLWFSPKQTPQSKWQRFLKSMRKAGVEFNTDEELVGQFVEFEENLREAVIEGEERQWTVWKAVNAFENEQVARHRVAELQDEAAADTMPTDMITDPDDIDPAVVRDAIQLYESMGDYEQLRALAENNWNTIDPDAIVEAVRQQVG